MSTTFKFIMAIYVIYSVFKVVGRVASDDVKNDVSTSVALIGIFLSGMFSIMYLAD